MQLKGEAKLLTLIELNTKHADCRIIFMLYPIRLFVTNDNRAGQLPINTLSKKIRNDQELIRPTKRFRPTKRLISTLASTPPVATDNYRWVIKAETMLIFQYIQPSPKR